MPAKKNNKIKVVVIGSGNLSWHIVSHLSFFSRFELLVYNKKHTPRLAQLKKEFKVAVTDDWKDVSKHAEFYFVCTSDSFIKATALKIKKLKTKGIIIHCSGTVSLSAISSASKNTGVFYPLQTFTFGKSVNWHSVPVFIEASNKDALFILKKLAGLFTQTVVELNSKQRIKLHLAAVVAANFTNAMYVAAYKYLAKEIHPDFFTYLMPLINQTVVKIKTLNPVAAQTGPASRNDQSTIDKHLNILKSNPELKALYKTISKLIVKQQKTNVKL